MRAALPFVNVGDYSHTPILSLRSAQSAAGLAATGSSMSSIKIAVGVNAFGNIDDLFLRFFLQGSSCARKTLDRTFRFTNETEPISFNKKADSYEFENKRSFVYGNSYVTRGLSSNRLSLEAISFTAHHVNKSAVFSRDLSAPSSGEMDTIPLLPRLAFVSCA